MKNLTISIFLLSYIVGIVYGCDKINNAKVEPIQGSYSDKNNFYSCKFFKLINEKCIEDLGKDSALYILLSIQFPYADSSMVITMKELMGNHYVFINKISPMSDYLFTNFNKDQVSVNLDVYRIDNLQYNLLLLEINKLMDERHLMKSTLVNQDGVFDNMYYGLIFSNNKKVYSHITNSLKEDVIHDLVEEILIICKQNDLERILNY